MFKIRLKNYRGFANEELIFSKINILIGENSAGKSSIFKFLLALKQSLRTSNNRDSNLTFTGIDTDLGNYAEAVFNHEIDRNIAFSFEFLQGYFPFFLKEAVSYPSRKGEEESIRKQIKQKRDDITDLLGGEILDPNLIEFELTNDLSSHSNIKTLISNKSIGSVRISHKRDVENQAEQDIYLINDKPTCDIIFRDGYKRYVFNEINYEKMGFLTIIGDTDFEAKIREEVNQDETVINSDKQRFAEALYWKIAYLLISQNYIQAQLSGIEYINPILSKPAERVYFEGDKRNTLRTGDIKALVDFLSTNNTKPQFRENLSKALLNFGIADDIYIKKEGFTRELRVVLNGLDSNIKDVGYGVSLQLPILAQAIISDSTARLRNGEEIIKGETLLIEQPEVHLHPRLQAKFINALLQIGSNNRYIIETHSEHIVRMLQIIVKEGRYNIVADDVSINYFKNEGGKMVKTMHLIDSKTGKLIPSFPKGFYDVSYNLAFELMD